MRKFPGAALGVDQGTEEVFTDFEDGGEMWTGHGTRERRKAVTFSEPFRSPPVVQVALTLWDMDSQSNVRADISAEKVTPAGFEMVFFSGYFVSRRWNFTVSAS